MYFLYTTPLYDCIHTFGAVPIILQFHFILLFYLTFVFNIPEDGHIVGQNV